MFVYHVSLDLHICNSIWQWEFLFCRIGKHELCKPSMLPWLLSLLLFLCSDGILRLLERAGQCSEVITTLVNTSLVGLDQPLVPEL